MNKIRDLHNREWVRIEDPVGTNVVGRGEAFFVMKIDVTHVAVVMDGPRARDYINQKNSPGVTYHVTQLSGGWSEDFISRVRDYLRK